MKPDIKIFTDASSVAEIKEYSPLSWVSGFTTNPTLMRKSGVTDYRTFAQEALQAADQKSLSLEVVADDLTTMLHQGKILGSWGPNVAIKIPVTTTAGASTLPIVRALLDEGFTVNVTAIMTDEQINDVLSVVTAQDDVIASVFAGRIADSGVDPVPIMARYASLISEVPGSQLLWASPREVLNIVQAADCGCDIITVTPELLGKMSSLGKGLNQFSLETVRMFYEDARSSDLTIT